MSAFSHRVGATLLELLVAIGILAILAAITSNVYGQAHTQMEEAECRTQLTEVNAALLRYREEHRGQDPPSLEVLGQLYLQPEKLICPLVRHRAPEDVAWIRALRKPTVFKDWSSYFLFSRRGLDRLYETGQIPSSYSQILAKRSGETPLVVCYDHREPRSLVSIGRGTPQLQATWHYPERPVLVLRQNGNVGRSHYGGLSIDGTQMDTIADALHL